MGKPVTYMKSKWRYQGVERKIDSAEMIVIPESVYRGDKSCCCREGLQQFC